MRIERRAGESDLQFHKRLIYGKLVDKTLADMDYTEIAEAVYGKPYSSDVARRLMYGSKHTLELMEKEKLGEITDKSILSEIDRKQIELQKERQRFFDQRKEYSRILRERARQEELNELLVKAVQQGVESGKLPTLESSEHEIVTSDNDLLVSLNDIHYGADIHNYWNTYNSAVCREMFGSYLKSILRIAKIHGSQNCIVWQNGDSISGNIHPSVAASNRENVVEQVQGVSELIAEFLAELSKHFAQVIYVSVSGNHSRLNPNKEKALPSERLDDLVAWYLRASLQNSGNILIGGGNRVDESMYLIRVRGKVYCGVHGDYDGSAEKIQALQTMAGVPLYAVLSGHLHHSKLDEVQGVKTVMAGSFLGMDDYCVQKRIFGSAEQMVCVCDEDGIVCSYCVPLKS